MAKLEEDQAHVKKWIWSDRDAVLDMILMHTCERSEQTKAIMRLAGVDVEEWILIALTHRNTAGLD